MAQVLISGGSGFIGQYLCQKLETKGYKVAILSRNPDLSSRFKTYYWNLNNEQVDPQAIASSDYIIHLAGANIAEKRWTKARKKQILDSRVKSTKLLFKEVQKQNKNLKAFISASAIGYYGAITTDRIFNEEDAFTNDFLGQTCHKWEEAVKQFKPMVDRTIMLRTGLVLDRQSGALPKMLRPAKLGLASALGTGKQYLPWIHIEDLCEIYIKAIEDKKMNGIYNAVAPDFQTNKSFTQTLTKSLNKAFFLPPVPSFILKLVLGELSQLVLQGSRVSANKLISAGYKFKFTQLEKALQNLLH